MPRFNNLSIGAKLGITSSLGVLLVIGMIGAMIHGDFAVMAARERADHAQTMIATAALFKAAARGMQVGVLAIRLAASPEEFKKPTQASPTARNRPMNSSSNFCKVSGRRKTTNAPWRPKVLSISISPPGRKSCR